jgi:histidine triad (HIT) family protein
VIPKGAYVQMDEFTAKASEAELAGFLRAVGEVVRQTGLDQTGYRLIVNNGPDGRQDVPHLHMHVVGGAPLGRMLPKT